MTKARFFRFPAWRLVSALALALGIIGAPGRAAPETAGAAALTVPMLHDFLRGAVRGIMLHESAHALIGLLDLPLVGPEEDVADEFAAMVTIAGAQRSELGHRNALALVDTSFTFWNLFKQNAAMNIGSLQVFDSTNLEDYDSHSPDIRRAFHTLCLLYGAFPERYGMVPERVGMTPGDAAHCVDDYQRKARAWERILAPHRLQTLGTSFTYRYTPSAAPKGRFYENLYLGFLDIEWSVARLLNFEIVLPNPLPMERTDCGVANAFFDPNSKQIILCNELVHDLAEGYVLNLTGLSYDAWWSEELARRAPSGHVGLWRMISVAGVDGDPVRLPQDLALNADGTFVWTIRWSQDPSGIVRPDTERRGLWGVETDQLWLLETAWVPSLTADCLYSGCEPPGSMDGLEARRAPIKWLGADKLDYNNGIIFERDAGG